MKLGRAVTFMKYVTSVVTLIFLKKNVIWNEITFSASNSLNHAELMVNELMNSISKRFTDVLFFITD